MRISALELINCAGLDKVQVSELSDVVVIAGPNGVGKTRLIRSILDFFRNPQARGDIHISIEATCEPELAVFGKKIINTNEGDSSNRLRTIVHRNQKRNQYKSTVLSFDSDRSFTNVQPFQFSWGVIDPFLEDVGWDVSYSVMRDRFNDVQHSIFKMVEASRRRISDEAVRLKGIGKTQMDLDFPDPLKTFKEAFYRLLAPKKFVEANLPEQSLYYEHEGKRFNFTQLSSGEREVVSIVFDFILRNPSHCIIIFDEPELHLHPELSFKLLQTLSSVGASNQFIFCTHSPEIITASLDNTVIFLTPKKPDQSNQALVVNRSDATHHALNLLGQSIGIISLGKRLLLIEGDDASLDKQTYGAILKNEFPDLVMVPVGGKSSIKSFNEVRASILNKTIWGVEFFLLCDRDAANSIGPNSVAQNISDRFRMLPRYHLENYFLDETVLAKVFSEMEPPGSQLADPNHVLKVLTDIAKGFIPYSVCLHVSSILREMVGNVDLMPGGVSQTLLIADVVDKLQDRAKSEVARVSSNLDLSQIKAVAEAEYARLSESIDSGSAYWRINMPGRPILNSFAKTVKHSSGRLKTQYLRAADELRSTAFDEIRGIFRDFRAVPNQVAQPTPDPTETANAN